MTVRNAVIGGEAALISTNAGVNFWVGNNADYDGAVGILPGWEWKDLLEHGIYTNAVIVPAVPRGQAMLRTSYIASHTDEQLERALELFGKLGRRHGIID